ncbi:MULTISPECIES: type VII secretion-associated serine protease mycosin [Gordonia]|uniref:Peptidase S8 family protein n=2 Tax=Gordonia TaxID=2053 RepID=L7LN96_9ACTN|nr:MULTISPECIES: type VII secretion-associated serine protease mycosin [Gordonia]AUH69633.1 type VII secretion-associated serine protease mycosin [Gordonia sp. YC-JH1]KXT57455.1 membrane protein [Gordonia sp. QH-12]GAC62605.1 peptidase S8 family protein [Gordonia sihwensis NBRC 108236]
MIRRIGAITAVAAVVWFSGAGAAVAVPAPVIARATVSAAPLGPPEPTEQRARCATTADADTAGEPAGHRLLDVAAAHRFSRGAGVSVAVIDTGVSPHTRLPRLVAGGDYVGTGDGLSDCDAHGTLVAGIIAAQPSADDDFVGVAPEATIISIRQSSGAFSARGSGADDAVVGAGYGPLTTLARSVVRAVDLGARVINISEVACAPAAGPLDDGLVGTALAYARERDVVVVVAAGNLTETTACREQNPSGAASVEQAWARLRTAVTPARFAPLVLTVGAVAAADGAAADFSLRGPWVSVAAPGTDVVSVMPGSGGPRLAGGLRTGDGVAPLAGTSYAAPYVSGLAALIRSRYPRLSAAEVIDRIVDTAHGGGRDDAVGSGVIDPLAALTDDPEVRAAPGLRPLALPDDEPESGSGAGVILAGAGFAAVAVVGGRLLRRRR